MKSGVTITRQDDFDGSKAARDRASTRRARLVPVAKAERDVPFPHAYDRIERRTAELHREGYTLKDATAMALAEDPAADEKQAQAEAVERAEIAGNRVTARTLQREGLKVTGGGGGGARRKKKGSWICRSCRLEFCEHRPKRGQPRKAATKTEHVSARISKNVRETLTAAGITPARAMEIAAAAIMQRRTYADVAKRSAA